ARSDERPVASAGPSLTRRRLRAGLLLASLLWVPTSIVLAAVGVLLWMSVPFAFLTVVAVLVYLRTEVAADRVRAAGGSDHLYADDHADEYDDHDDANGANDADEWADTGHAEPKRELTSDDTQVIHAPSHRPAAASRPRPAAAVFDVQAPVTRTPRRDQAAAVQAPAAPAAQVTQPADGTWVPVPVPTPTYAMKAKAPTRLTESGIPADVFATPEFADEADELDDRALFARRAVSQ
ncbi:MAG: hypothetical protein ABIS35_05330, partial [Terracoccus sp.]